MKYSVIILSCALVAVSQNQTEQNDVNKLKPVSGAKQIEITDDLFQPLKNPLFRQTYSTTSSSFPLQSQFLNGNTVNFMGPFVQNENQYSSNSNQYNQQDALWLKCGNVPCPRTSFVCQIPPCQYSNEFDDLLLRSRSSLQRGDELIQSIADILLSVSVKAVKEGGVVQIPNAKFLHGSTRAVLTEVTDNIAMSDQFLLNDVIGQVAQDVLIDLENLQGVLTIMLEWLFELDQGKDAKIPASVYYRAYRPKDWTPNCSGRWPCTNIIIYPARYAYSQQRPSCSCSIFQGQEFMYQNPTQVFREAMPIQMLMQPSQQIQQAFTSAIPQQLYSQSSQVFTQPQYQTLRYQPFMSVSSMDLTNVRSADSTTIVTQPLTKSLVSSGSSVQRIVTQPQSHLITQVMYPATQFKPINLHQIKFSPETRSHFENIMGSPLIMRLDMDNYTTTNGQTIRYSQPQFQTIKQYQPAIYSSEREISQSSSNSDLNESNDGSILQTTTQFASKPTFLQAKQVFAKPQYQTIKQYQPAMSSSASSQSISEFSRLDEPSGSNTQQTFSKFSQIPKLGGTVFTQTKAFKQYQPAMYIQSRPQSGSEMNPSDDANNSQQPRSFGDYQPSMMMRSIDSSSETTTPKAN